MRFMFYFSLVLLPLALSSCASRKIEKAPEQAVLEERKPKGTAIARRVHRRMGRLGPEGGKLGYEEKFEYPQIPLVVHPEVTEQINFYTTSRRSFIKEALSRREQYLPEIEATLKRYNLPLELSNLALIWSGCSRTSP